MLSVTAILSFLLLGIEPRASCARQVLYRWTALPNLSCLYVLGCFFFKLFLPTCPCSSVGVDWMIPFRWAGFFDMSQTHYSLLFCTTPLFCQVQKLYLYYLVLTCVTCLVPTHIEFVTFALKWLSSDEIYELLPWTDYKWIWGWWQWLNVVIATRKIMFSKLPLVHPVHEKYHLWGLKK